MSEFHVVYEHPFTIELDVIEPDHMKQLHLSMRIEAACIRRVMDGWWGFRGKVNAIPG